MKRNASVKILVLTLSALTCALVATRAAETKEIWAKSCTKCHGEDGKGATKMGKMVGVKDFTDAQVQDAMKDDAMVKAIKEGVKDGEKTRMKPAEDVSDTEIKALVAYVRAFKK